MDNSPLHEQLKNCVRAARDGLGLLEEELQASSRQCIRIVQSTVDTLRNAEALLEVMDTRQATGDKSKSLVACNMLHLTEQVVRAYDARLEAAGLRASMTIGNSIPDVAGVPERVSFILCALLDYVIYSACDTGHVEVFMTEVQLRQSVGVEWRAVVHNPNFTERDRYSLFEMLGSSPTRTSSSYTDQPRRSSLSTCRKLVDVMGGALWAATPKPEYLALVLSLPAICVVHDVPVDRCKLDIAIRNYVALRDALGTSKVCRLLGRVEATAQHVVRHPRDTVMAFEPRGVVSAILAASRTEADTITCRIQDAMQSEGLHDLLAEPVEFDFLITEVS